MHKPCIFLIFFRYDYFSIMHFGQNAFSKEPSKLNTIESKDENIPTKIASGSSGFIGQRSGLSKLDILRIIEAYVCKFLCIFI